MGWFSHTQTHTVRFLGKPPDLRNRCTHSSPTFATAGGARPACPIPYEVITEQVARAGIGRGPQMVEKDSFMKVRIPLVCVVLSVLSFVAAAAAGQGRGGLRDGALTDPLTRCLTEELGYSMEHLAAPDGTKPYYIAYSVYDEERAVVAATLGALTRDDDTRERNLNIDLRVGDYKLDNTHQLRGGGPSRDFGSGNRKKTFEQFKNHLDWAIKQGPGAANLQYVFRGLADQNAQKLVNQMVEYAKGIDKGDGFTSENITFLDKTVPY